MPLPTLELPTQIRIPALKLPEGEELEPLDLHDLAEALRHDGPSLDPGEAGSRGAMRGGGSRRGTAAREADAPWRLIVPRTPGGEASSRQLLEALAPLSARRRALEPLYYDVDPDSSDYQAIGRFCDTYADQIGETTYFLIAGTGAEIPFAIQAQLGVGKAVGRLGFPSLDAYASYALKVVAAEKHAPVKVCRPIMSFGPGTDDATRFSQRVLIEPAGRMLGRDAPARGVLTLSGAQASHESLLEALSHSDDEAPSLLFSATHGAEVADPRSADQGALATNSQVLLRAADLDGRTTPLLKHGIALLFACNGAGTPKERWWPSIFPHPPATSPGEDRIAALPLAMLSMPQGPLAVVSHLDVLSDWGLRNHAAETPSNLDDSGVVDLRNTLRALARGVPAGISLRPIMRAASELQWQFYRTLYIQGRMPGPHDVRQNINLARAWRRWHDVQGWILLGDPRVCLEGVPGQLLIEDVLRG